MTQHRGFIGFFVHHKVAANLVMLVMLLGGALGIARMNIQFFPTFALDIVNVRVVWSGASAEDIEQGITNPLEQRLRSLDSLKRMTSTSAQGISNITLEFDEGSDPVLVLDDARQQVDSFTNLPETAEAPEVSRLARYEPVARLLVHGDLAAHELRQITQRFEDELLLAGIDRVQINGLPAQQISIEVPAERLQTLGLSLGEIAARVLGMSRDLPAGLLGQQDSTRELRSLEQRRDALAFEDLTVMSSDRMQLRLGDIAIIHQEPREGQVTLSYRGQPAAEMILQRAESGDSLEAAQRLDNWIKDVRPTLPPGVELDVFDESWQLIDERISLLLVNGATGLLLVVVLLYFFLPAQVAFWVAVGIPTAFMASLGSFWLIGGSINMLSLFALIMALGVIVDDAIVVGEDADAHYRMGEDPKLASAGAARRMLWPVVASSLTTVAAFMPLLMVGGVIGNILGDIPVIMICVLIASLLECFVVLPAHLRNAFVPKKTVSKHSVSQKQKKAWNPARGIVRLRERFETRFDSFREGPFRRLSLLTLRYRGATLATALAITLVSAGLLAGGRMGFNFFPSPESSIVYANASFVAGTERARVADLVDHMQSTLQETDQAMGGGLVRVAVSHYGATQSGGSPARTGDEVGSLMVEMISPDARDVRNAAFIQAWRERIQTPAGLDTLNINERAAGPPGKDVNVRLTGEDAQGLRDAADRLSQAMAGLPGVLSTEDDMPWGREQLIYRVNAYGEALGMTTEDLGSQLRTAFDGQVVQIHQAGADEIEVRVQLPRAQRESLSTLSRLAVTLADGRQVPLSQVMTLSHRQGFETLRHADGQLAVEVTAEINDQVTSAEQVLASLSSELIPRLEREYFLSASFEGRAADQRETMADMRTGLVIGLGLMYGVLTWVFASWSLPLIVLAIIPFSLVGALLGHWALGIDLTILSLFGLFGLSGIVVNNAIILVSFYRQQRAQGLAINAALNEAVVQRVRAVLLTSLTTIGGLLPLLFETSLQAQFLIPMATSIAFGLGGSMVLVLLVTPALLSWLEHGREWWATRVALA
ncbi:efflux RND transporter permease subunit [Halomonas llamarensis]|uniref:Efflux RND transporter permease subunit n=1 Tax=Halomonas llamarensis TaxID=2945104 RepID=A0ABT0SMN2_9GAMM|nr:efflux RND transporter permease subunit [Halomonas llamarensis]MCL7929064.1 efflux RND transporter permease subunit [Halomonas llamarensis]